MTYTYPVEEYKKLLIEYNKLEELSFTPDDSKDFIIEKLEERSAKKREISEKANTMIREYVETYEKDPSLITDEVLKTLDEFEETVFPSGKMTSEVPFSDFGIYYRIAKIMAAHYKKNNDLNGFAVALNRCSVAHQTLVNGHKFTFVPSPHSEDCVELSKHLGTNEIVGKAREKVLIALGRDTFKDEKSFDVEQIRKNKETLLKYMGDPRSEIEETILSIFHTSMLEVFREHNIYAREHGIRIDLEAARPLLKETVGILNAQMKENKTYGMPVFSLKQLFLTTDYFLGDISLETLLDGLSKLQADPDGSDNPIVQVAALTTINHIYLTLLCKFSPLPREEIVRISRERIKEALPKIVQVTRMVNNVQFNRYLVMFLNGASLTGNFDDFAQTILESTVYADKALFIHTVMVKELSRVIFDLMIERSPELFDGVAGRNAGYIRDHKDEMKALLDDCCMFHDIGKFFELDIVGNSMRKLTDDEFSLIKEHPGNFDNICQMQGEQDERFKCIRDCALTHHLWHDGTKGYPNVKHTKNRPLVDIISIADSIDAATDYIGRPYHSRKTLDELIDEIQNEAGTRYGNDAASVLSAPEVKEKLREIVTERRKEVNYRVYAFNRDR